MFSLTDSGYFSHMDQQYVHLLSSEYNRIVRQGVGLLVGRNIDRGDAAKLPPEQLDLCEIEPLRQRESHSPRSLIYSCLYIFTYLGFSILMSNTRCQLMQRAHPVSRGLAN